MEAALAGDKSLEYIRKIGEGGSGEVHEVRT